MRVRTARIDFGQQVNQESGLGRVVRRILVDPEKTHHALDEVVKRGPEVRRAVAMIAASPAVKAQAIVLIFFQRRGVEDTINTFADLDRFDVIAGLSSGAPVKGVDVLENSEHHFFRQPLPEQGWQMLGRKVRLAEQHYDERVGMTATYFGNLVGGMSIAGSDFAQILTRHAIQSIDECAMVTGGGE